MASCGQTALQAPQLAHKLVATIESRSSKKLTCVRALLALRGRCLRHESTGLGSGLGGRQRHRRPRRCRDADPVLASWPPCATPPSASSVAPDGPASPAGCDITHVTAGDSSPSSRPHYPTLPRPLARVLRVASTGNRQIADNIDYVSYPPS